MVKNLLAKALRLKQSLPKRLDFFIEPVLVFILAASPLLFGSVRPFHVTAIEVSTLLLLFICLASSIQKGSFQFIAIPGTFPILLFTAYLAAQYFFADLLLYNVFMPGEAYRQKMKSEIIKVVMYAVLFYTVLNNFTQRKKLKRLLYALVFIGFCLALLGILQKLSGATKIFWVGAFPEKASKYTAFFSCFPSRDHFANYMNMLTFLTLGFLFSRLPRLREAVRGFDRASISKGLSLAFRHKIWLYTFAIIIMASSVFYSLCRGAIVSFLLSIVFFSVLVAVKGLTRRGNMALFLVILFTAGMLLWVGAPQQINKRFIGELGKESQFTHMVLKDRKVFIDTTVSMIKTYPIFGIGIGAFEFVYDKNYKPERLSWAYVDHAHNDILEFISEVGFFGTAAFLLVIGFYLFLFIGLFLKRREPFSVGVSAGCLAAMFSMLVHSLFDFNFHITSNAILFFAIAALGLCAAGSRVEETGETSLLVKTKPILVRNAFTKTALFAILLIGFAYTDWFVIKPYMAYRVTEKKNPTLLELNRARQILPLSDKCHFALAKFFANHAVGKKRVAYERLAVKEAKMTIRLNPWYDYYNAYLTELEKTFGEADEHRRSS